MWRLRTLLLVVSVVVYTIVFGLIAILFSLFDREGDVLQKIATLWAGMITRTNRIRVRLSMEEDPGTGPFVIITNHQSYLDIPALLVSLPYNFRMVAKKELFRIPIFGWGIKLAGYIEVDRSDTRKAIRGISEADNQLSAGRSIVIFPEGTRSRDGNLLPFKKGAFVLALKNQVPILPCLVHGGFLLLPKGTLRMGKADMNVHLGKPISTRGLAIDERNSLKSEVEVWMQQVLSEFNQFATGVSNQGEGREKD